MPPITHRRQRSLHLDTGAGVERHRHETEAGDQRGHQHWPQPDQCAIDDRFHQVTLFVPQFADEGDHGQSVERSHTRQRNDSVRIGVRKRSTSFGQTCKLNAMA